MTVAEARQILQEFVAELEARHAAKAFQWDDLGVSDVTVRHLRRGRGVRPETVETVAKAAGFAADTPGVLRTRCREIHGRFMVVSRR